MPVMGYFVRTSTSPDLMMYMETPGAPSRTMTSEGGNSASFKQVPSLARLSLLSSANSLTFFRKRTSWASVSFTTADIYDCVSEARPPGRFSLPSWRLFPHDELVSLARGLQEVKAGNWGRVTDNYLQIR